jgi:hypothetical protein
MKAAAIRTIGKRAVCDLIEIGRLLTDAKLLAGRGNWLPWLDREFGWSDETARKWMNAPTYAIVRGTAEAVRSCASRAVDSGTVWETKEDTRDNWRLLS